MMIPQSTELNIPRPFMGQVSEAAGKTVNELIRSMSSPASRAGIATCLGVTVIMARMRVPFPVTLFTAIVLGDTAEKTYMRLIGRDDVRPDGS